MVRERESSVRLAESARRIVVARGRRWEIVHLHRLYVTERNGVRAVSLADVWVAAGLRGDLFALSFDFLDELGAPASRWGEARLDSSIFARGWLDVDTRDVDWETGEDVPNHWRMRRVGTIVAVERGARRCRPAARRPLAMPTPSNGSDVANIVAGGRNGTDGTEG
jgi:hypothetical protein